MTGWSDQNPTEAARVKQPEAKLAIATGGAAGFGEAIVRLFVQEGAGLLIAGLDEARGRALGEVLGPERRAFTGRDVAKGSSVAPRSVLA